jgi:hypothetical protein
MKIKIKSTGKAKAGREKKVIVPLTNKRLRYQNKMVCLGLKEEVEMASISGHIWD